MTVEEFENQINQLVGQIETNAPNNMWQFGIERLVEQLRGEIGGNLAANLGYQINGSLVEILAPNYLLYQNYGVAGAEGNSKGARADEFAGGRVHTYGTSMPPASVFSRYTTDPNQQFAIAKSIFKFGIRPKGYFTRQSLINDYLNYVRSFINDNV